MSAWIACSDECALPEDNEPVLWCTVPVVEPYVVASMCDYDWKGSFTHWMPLPGPPGGSDQPADAAGAVFQPFSRKEIERAMLEAKPSIGAKVIAHFEVANRALLNRALATPTAGGAT